jgi:hypothetical protein
MSLILLRVSPFSSYLTRGGIGTNFLEKIDQKKLKVTRIAWTPFLRLSFIKNTIHRMFGIYVPSVVDPGSALILVS